MILVPVLLEHRVDPIRRRLADMFLNRLDEIVKSLMQPGIGEIVDVDVLHPERAQGSPRFRLAIDPGRGSDLALAEHDGADVRTCSHELRKCRAAAKLKVVWMSAER
jgi:hypothetical protein